MTAPDLREDQVLAREQEQAQPVDGAAVEDARIVDDQRMEELPGGIRERG